MNSRVHILMYHRVGHFPDRMPSHRGQYCHLPRFKAQMAMLRHLGCRVIGLDEVVAGLRGEATLPDRAVALTFDDAYVDFLEHAAPVLAEYRYPACVYAVAGMLGGKSDWVAPEGLTPAPLMDATQLREVQAMGFTVGSHTMSHPRLARVESMASITRELVDSKRVLEDTLGRQVDHFCYPYGSHDLRAVDAAAAAGYRSATTCLRAAATARDDLLTLPRKAVHQGTTAFGLFWKLLARNHYKSPPIRRSSPAA